jgi:phage terminase large subunit-like protein
LGGRGAGKTRAGAEWVRRRIQEGSRRIALVGPSYADVREVMIEGESGLRNIGYPSERPRYESSRRRLLWPNGAVGYVFSSQEPDGLRGPQFDAAWADEFCAWSYPHKTLSNLRFGLRLGECPQLIITTTPKPIAPLRALIEEFGVLCTRSSTHENTANLSPHFLNSIVEIYGGTRLGRQELDGEILDDMPGSLWPRSLIDRVFTKSVPRLERVIIAVDPPVSVGPDADSCGIIVAGMSGEAAQARAYILYDGSVQGLSPEAWAKRVLGLWECWDADYILVEVNQGGEMVKSVFRAIGSDALIKTVYASKNKCARAEPVAALYEQGRVKHIEHFAELEDELCRMGTQKMGAKSPDRADALVWAVTDLLLKDRAEPSVRSL